MKNTIMVFLILSASAAGVCLAENSVGNGGYIINNASNASNAVNATNSE